MKQEEYTVELLIPGSLKNEPIICDIIRKFKITLKIVEASFSAESGWALLTIEAARKEFDRMAAYLGGKGVNVHLRQRQQS